MAPYRDLLGAPSGPCPRCAEPLHTLSRGKTHVYGCKTCGGVLADRTTLERFAGGDRADLQALADEATRAPPGPTTARGPIECPWCQAQMRALAVPAAKCTIDLCPTHGVWFDRWEAQIVTAAVRDPAAATALRLGLDASKDE